MVSEMCRMSPWACASSLLQLLLFLFVPPFSLQTSDRFDKYVDMLVEARKKKGMTREVAADTLHGTRVRGR